MAAIPANITMTLEQYTALVALARLGVPASQTDPKGLEQFLQTIEKVNNITRYLLWVQWQELDSPLPANTSFPETWPPNQRQLIQTVNKIIALTDVKAVLKTYAKNPTNVLVTPDPNALVGWTQLSAYFSS